jgi:hypothetical protein
MYWVEPGSLPSNKATRLIAFSVGRIEGQQTHYYKQLSLAEDAVPFLTLDAAVGKVNNKVWQGCEPGTLLYMPYKEERFTMALGVTLRVGVHIEHTIIYQPIGHNKLLQALKDKPQKYYYVTTDGALTPADIADPTLPALAGKWLYDYADFDALFLSRNP